MKREHIPCVSYLHLRSKFGYSAIVLPAKLNESFAFACTGVDQDIQFSSSVEKIIAEPKRCRYDCKQKLVQSFVIIIFRKEHVIWALVVVVNDRNFDLHNQPLYLFICGQSTLKHELVVSIGVLVLFRTQAEPTG